ncbi:MAG: HD domain-containing protein, partial [Myxococcales bacterium]|nr:HD domain-containing protein [Myxococcales bacterium]
GDGAPDSRATWDELVRVGVLVPREAQEIGESEEFLWRVRNRLHARAGRRADRLGFEEQEALAVSMGYEGDRARAAEGLMQAYYLNARRVSRARASLFARLRPHQRSRPMAPVAVQLGGGVGLFDGQVTISGLAELQQDPVIAMRALATCVRQQARMLPFARDAITRAADEVAWRERLRSSPEAAAKFVELVCTVPEARTRRGSIVGELHEMGLLLAMVPEFFPVTGRVHHDIYHVYTVDVHSVAALDRLRQIARGELAREFPLASRLAAEIARPKPLFLATLLHDVGKGYPDATGSRRNHSKVGADLCECILPRLGFSGEDVEEAQKLVLDHLLMYHVATRRDLDDIATIAEFCERVRGREGLRNLYLLTVADLSTTSPTAMTSWKARMLEELYFAAEAYLAGHRQTGESERLARVYSAVRSQWDGPAPQSGLDALLASLPERYLLANRPESIVHHARAVSERGGRPVHVVLVPSRRAEAAEICVVADDRPGLLASVAAAITASRLEVLKAEVYSHPVGAEREALDLFWVRDRDGGVETVEEALPRLAADLLDVCSGRVAPAELLRARTGSGSPWRERPTPAVVNEILFDHRSSPRHTIIEVFVKDRPGLLHSLAQALHDLCLSITLSKINTEGARVVDVFYVTEADGSKLAPGNTQREREITEALLSAAAGEPREPVSLRPASSR